MHKNSQAPQCILLSGRLEFTAARRRLHLHVLQPPCPPQSQYIRKANELPVHPLTLLQPSIWGNNTMASVPGTQCRNMGSFLVYHVTPMSICGYLAEIHITVVYSVPCLFLVFHFPGEDLSPSKQARERSVCSLPCVPS